MKKEEIIKIIYNFIDDLIANTFHNNPYVIERRQNEAREFRDKIVDYINKCTTT